MKSDNPLDEIWESYQTTIDCLKVTSRSIEKCENHLLRKTNFIALSQEEADQRIRSSRSGVDDYVILSLWAVFERQVFYYVQKECGKMLGGNSSDFNKRTYEKLSDEIEYWRVDDVLDIFKTVVNQDLIGHAKQIKKYRDWIAHRNPKKAAPSNVPPKTAYEVLSSILSLLQGHPDLSEK